MKTMSHEISNSWIAQELKRRCDGKDTNEQLREYMSLLQRSQVLNDYGWKQLRDTASIIIGPEFDAWSTGAFTRAGYHIFGEDERPVDYVPNDHCSYIYCNPTDRFAPQDWKNEAINIYERKFFVHCQLCGSAVLISDYTKLYLVVPGTTDLVVLCCPRFLSHGRLVWAEGYNALPQDIKPISIERRLNS